MTVTATLRGAAVLAACGAVLCGCNLGVSQNAILVDTDSTSTTSSKIDPFTVTGPWQIRYTFDCTKENSEGLLNVNQFTIDVFNGDDNSTAYEHPQTTIVSVRRQGTLDFRTPGNYYVHVDTQCDWTLQVVDLSSGTVATSTPVPHIAQPHGTVHLALGFSSVVGFYNCDLTGTSAARCLVVDGTTSSSPFGALTMHRTLAVQEGVGNCLPATMSETLTTAGGDMLTVSADKGQVCLRPLADDFHFTVVGGTGIFKGATGSGMISGPANAAHRWSGTLTFPG